MRTIVQHSTLRKIAVLHDMPKLLRANSIRIGEITRMLVPMVRRRFRIFGVASRSPG